MNVRSISLIAVGVIATLLGALIYGAGLFIAMTFGSSPSWFLAFLPVIGQVYLVSVIWAATATLINLYTIALFVFGCLLVLLLILETLGRRLTPSIPSVRNR
jgi:hypothetical protein